MGQPSLIPARWAGLPAISGRRLGTVRSLLGEGPSWDAVREVIWWVDIKGLQLHRTSLDGTDRAIDVALTSGLRGTAGLRRPCS